MNDVVNQVHDKIKSAGLPDEVLARLSLARGSIQQLSIQPAAISRTVMLANKDQQSHIQLFKNFGDSPRAAEDLLEAYGELILLSSGTAGLQIWEKKLALADRGVADLFNQKLKSGNYSTFRALVESYGGAVERLVALHIANALIHHRQSFGDASNIDVFMWPHTEGLANGTVPYSLVPLISAYCDSDVWRHFPVAFRHRVMGTLAAGRKDVLDEFKKIVGAIGESAQSS
jgi:hypothetical protein